MFFLSLNCHITLVSCYIYIVFVFLHLSDMVNRLNPGDVVLITGGCGFLGKHLIQLLAEKMGGLAEIRVLDLEPRPANFELGK